MDQKKKKEIDQTPTATPISGSLSMAPAARAMDSKTNEVHYLFPFASSLLLFFNRLYAPLPPEEEANSIVIVT